MSCTPLSLAEVARRRAALRVDAFSSPAPPSPGGQRDENEQDRSDEVMA